MVGGHPSLSRLELASETVNDAAARDIGRLAISGTLHTLQLRGTALAGAGAATVTRSLSLSRGLVRLDLSDNHLGHDAVRELARSLPAEAFAVRCLGLARCGLGPEAGAALAEALGGNLSVEELDLSDNGLGESAGLALAESLRTLYRNGQQASFLCRDGAPGIPKLSTSDERHAACMLDYPVMSTVGPGDMVRHKGSQVGQTDER